MRSRLSLRGRVTLPAQSGMERETLLLAEKWGADAVRDSDGTKLSDEILKMGYEVYSTLCLIREDSDWTKAHPQYLQQAYLMSEPEIADGDAIKIDLMKYYFHEQFAIDEFHDPHIWWEVIDRTTGDIVDNALWEYVPGKDIVIIKNVKKWHKYTVSFLVYQIWEPVSMYNHITNSWTEEHKMPLDPRHPEAREHMLKVLKEWLETHPQTDVVRFTTFFYNFDLIYGQNGKERQVDWFGYLSCVSPLAMEQFQEEYGYRLRPEDFIDQGYFNSPFRVPTRSQLDWMDFNQRFIAKIAGECVDLVHNAGKKAIMFLGDHWAGTEPYGKYFREIGLDAVVGAAGDGVTTRMIADIPVKATEARFYPYFFPDVFYEGGDPVKESTGVWTKSRRAIMRNPVDRMGYGGYLELAVKFPGFVEHVAEICRQFREIHTRTRGTKPYTAPFKIAVLNAWGGIRTWQTHQIAHSLWNRRCYSYLGIMEALSGLSFEVKFISFEELLATDVLADTGIIINAGDAGTAWSGHEYWKDERILSEIRKWVWNGGGFIGVGEPTACEYQGAFFQLEDVLGVQKETGYGLSRNKPEIKAQPEHFITDDNKSEIDFGEGMNSIYKCGEETRVLSADNYSCDLAVNTYGKGRSVYISGLPFSFSNTRLLQRALYWAAGKEGEMFRWFASNPMTECFAYPGANCYAVINNSLEEQTTDVYRDDGSMTAVSLEPMECRWMVHEFLDI